MPLYQYRCEEHGQFDKIRKLSERDSAPCPECGKDSPKDGLTAPRGIAGGYYDPKMYVR